MIIPDNTRVLRGSYSFKVVNKADELERYSGTFDTLPEAMAWFTQQGTFHVGRGRRLVFCCYKTGRGETILGDEINIDTLKYRTPQKKTK
jgi:hypothetical protein